MELPVTLIKGDKIDKRVDYRDNLPVNMYAEERPILGAQGYMIAYPGLKKIATQTPGIDRAGVYNERFLSQYRVSGDKLISVAENGVVTELGTVSGAEQAALPYSFNTQAVIAGGNYYLYDDTNGFREVTDPDVGNPIDCVWVDGYYFFTDGEFLYHTNINDESQIDPLQFATAEFMPDPSLGLAKTQDNKVMVFGRYTIEYFVNTAAENFAFTRVETRSQKIGIVSTHAKTEAGGVHYIVGGRRDESLGIHMISLGSTAKISTVEIDKLLAQYSEPDLSDIRVESRLEDDTQFVIIHLPNETLCFNVSIASKLGDQVAWSILKTDVDGDLPYRGINGVFDARSGQWVYGDKREATLAQLDNESFAHYGTQVEGILYSPFINLKTFSISGLEIETIPGRNTSDDAKVAISTTRNGITYSNEWWMQYGEPLDYNNRFIIRRIGYVRHWLQFKFRFPTTSRLSFALFTIEYS